MSVSYGGQPMTLRERVKTFMPWLGSRKEALPIGTNMRGLFMAWQPATFYDRNFENFVEYGYRGNSAVFACVQALAIGFSEPPLRLYDTKTKEPVPDGRSPLQVLINRPNPLMGQKELWQYHMTYEPLGGNSYIYQMKSNGKQTKELWPYNGGKVWSVPDMGEKPATWLKEFRYDLGNNTSLPLAIEDVIHTKWAPDPEYYWRGMSALEPAWKEILSDNELTRFLKALLQNDAVPRSAIELPEGVTMDDAQTEKLRRMFRTRFGNDNRGDVAVLQGGAKLTRVALDLQELQLEGLRYIPESRIAADFKVPPIVAHLYVGLTKGTYSNYQEARRQFTEETLMPKWGLLADELTHNLLPEYDSAGKYYLAFDLTQVGALKEDIDKKGVWVVAAYDKGLLSINQGLQLLGLQTLDGPEGDTRKAVPSPPEPVTADDLAAATSNPPAKVLLPGRVESKALSPGAQGVEKQIAERMEAHLKSTYNGVAEMVGKS